MRFDTVILRVTALLALPILISACATTETPGSPPAAVAPQRTREQNIELGRQHKTAEELYKALKDEAKGGKKLEWNRLPDWSGVYSRPLDKGFNFDIDQPKDVPTSAKLTPDFQAKLTRSLDDLKIGIEWDPISKYTPATIQSWRPRQFLTQYT